MVIRSGSEAAPNVTVPIALTLRPVQQPLVNVVWLSTTDAPRHELRGREGGVLAHSTACELGERTCSAGLITRIDTVTAHSSPIV